MDDNTSEMRSNHQEVSNTTLPYSISELPRISDLFSLYASKGNEFERKTKAQKPKHVRNAYNFFFQEERAKILSERKNKHKKRSLSSADEDNAQSMESVRSTEKKLKQSRKRKVHGIVGFKELGQIVGKRWKATTPEERQKYIDLAAKDSERYKIEIEKFRESNERAYLNDRSCIIEHAPDAAQGKSVAEQPITIPGTTNVSKVTLEELLLDDINRRNLYDILVKREIVLRSLLNNSSNVKSIFADTRPRPHQMSFIPPILHPGLEYAIPLAVSSRVPITHYPQRANMSLPFI